MGPLTTAPLLDALRRLAAEHVVGIVFDEDHLCGVELVAPRGPGRARRVARSASLELSSGLVHKGEVTDHEGFVEALRTLWDRGGFRTHRVALGLDAGAVVLRRAELPRLSSDELHQAANYEIGDLLRYPLAQALVSSVELDRPEGNRRDELDPGAAGEGTSSVLTLAVHEATIDKLSTVARDAGLDPLPAELVLAALVSAEPRPADPDTVGVIVHVTAWTTDVVVHDAGGILFGRVIAAGIDLEETSISDQLAMELSMLEGYTSAAGGGPGPADQTNAAATVQAGAPAGLATVVEGVRRTIQYYLSEVDNRRLERVTLCGPQADAPGLFDALAECFPGADVVRSGGLAGVEELVTGPAFDAAYAVGVAATGGGDDLRRFDLVPAGIRARRADRRRLAVGVAAAVALVPLVAGDALGRRSDRRDRADEIAATEQVVAALGAELATYDDAAVRQIEADRATARVDALYGQDDGYPVLVRQVAEAMPEDSFLITLRINRANPGELPTGYNGPDPTGNLTASGVAGDLDGVGRWMQDVAAVEAVEGLWLNQTAFGPYNDSDQVAAVFTVEGAVVAPAVPPRTLGDEP